MKQIAIIIQVPDGRERSIDVIVGQFERWSDSKTLAREFRIITVAYGLACRTCDAQANMPCRRPAGRILRDMHATRIRDARKMETS